MYVQGEGFTCVYVNVRVDARLKLTLWWRAKSAAWRCCLACCRAAAWARTAASRSSPPSRHGPTGIWFSSCWTPAWRSCVTVKQITQKQTRPKASISPPTDLNSHNMSALVTSHPARSGSHAVLFPSNGHCLVYGREGGKKQGRK